MSATQILISQPIISSFYPREGEVHINLACGHTQEVHTGSGRLIIAGDAIPCEACATQVAQLLTMLNRSLRDWIQDAGEGPELRHRMADLYDYFKDQPTATWTSDTIKAKLLEALR